MRLTVVAACLFVLAAATAAVAASRNASPAGFSCAGKHLCRQMQSCEEARFYLETCGVASLDGDNDGVPCETICGSR
jgi:hypothetical protein